MIFINMNSSLTISQIIQEEIQSLFEQRNPPVFKPIYVPKFNANRIAKQIYDAKGTLVDDEKSVLNSMREIKNIKQYTAVLKVIQRLSGQGLISYLKSFLEPRDILDVALHLYDILPKNAYDWTIKKLISYDDLKTALAVATGQSNSYDRWRYGGDVSGNTITTINSMLYDDALYNKIREKDAQSKQDGFDVSDIILRPFVSTEYYLEHNTWGSFINAPGGLRDMVYSPLGIGITTAAALIPSPWTKVPVAILFGVLAVDDVSRIADGDDAAWFDLLFDSIGMFTGALSGAKILKPISQKFVNLMKWIKNGGILTKISKSMFSVFFDIISSISKTSFGKFLASGSENIVSMLSRIKTVISTSLSFIKDTLVKLKNNMPQPIKNWAVNALKSLKSVSVGYYMNEIKPMFDALKLIARGVKLYLRAPKMAVLELAKQLGIHSEWVAPVAYGTNAMWVTHLIQSLPQEIYWWKTWYDTQMNEAQKQRWISELQQFSKNWMNKENASFYTFKNKPGKLISLYSWNPGMDPEWQENVKKPIPMDIDTRGPIVFTGDKQKNGYIHVILPPTMPAVGEINDAWIKISDIVKIPL